MQTKHRGKLVGKNTAKGKKVGKKIALVGAFSDDLKKYRLIVLVIRNINEWRWKLKGLEHAFSQSLNHFNMKIEHNSFGFYSLYELIHPWVDWDVPLPNMCPVWIINLVKVWVQIDFDHFGRWINIWNNMQVYSSHKPCWTLLYYQHGCYTRSILLKRRLLGLEWG